MEQSCTSAHGARLGRGVACRLLIALAAWWGIGAAQAVTITVREANGTPVVAADLGGFRYTIEEDGTFDVVPDSTGLTANSPTLSLGMHRSHMKVVKVGRTAGATLDWTPPDSTKRYFISVMPNNPNFAPAANDLNQAPRGYTNSGVPIRAVNGVFPTDVFVPLNRIPFPTAQISVFVFEDTTLNGAPDAPGSQERGLCGFEVQLFEAGGTFGASGGRVSTDTFGNWLGTEYAFDNNGNPVLDNGAPVIAKAGAFQLFADANGVVRVKNLSPAKYTTFVVPPPDMPSQSRCHLSDANGQYPIWVRTAAQLSNDPDRRANQLVWSNAFELPPKASEAIGKKWHQTSTIEGTWGIDAWVKSNEPTFFKEFGPPGHHVFVGFTRRYKDTSVLNGGGSVTGIVKNTHMSRPPRIQFHAGAPMTACWVGINAVTPGVGLGTGVYANACNPDGSFQVTGLPNGRYQLVVWDEPLDNVIANYEFSVPAANGSTAIALGDVPVFSWFSKLSGKVFYDNEASTAGFPFKADGSAKPGIPGSVVNIRFRDGSIYNSTATDDEGNWEFAEVFPFFNWLTAETDFTRFKATGATIIADNGGPVIDPPIEGLWPGGTMAPQDIGGQPYRIFGGTDDPSAPSSANLLQTFQGFLGQTNVIHWGKREYDPRVPTDHGGITGVVHYASTRAEFDPKFATAENNEPGIPSVEIRLYRLNNQNMVVSPTRGVIAPAAAGEQDAVQVVVSDDYNKAPPEGCVDPIPYTDRAGNNFAGKCFDGMRIWNQVRNGVFDGGWAFVDYCPNGVTVNRDANGEFVDTTCVGGDAVTLPPGRYMTEGVAPDGYEHQKEEDKNVDFGDLLVPSTLANPAECIGSRSEGITYDDNGNRVAIPLQVPAELDIFAGVEIPARFRDAPGAPRPYCNKKLVVLAPGMNPFSDFHMFTKAPVAGHIVGMILDDLANEFDPYAPNFGEKYAPPFMPISIRDFAGNEINRVYSDRYGTYNALVPSTFAYNVPMPSGVAPNMVNVCLNSPTMKDAAGNTVIDPHYNPQYTQYCYTFQYLPGKTTYLDTPVLPIAAFAGPSQFGLDVAQPDGTPGIKMVGTIAAADVGNPNATLTGGPHVPATGTRTLRIVSMGMTDVANPAYDKTAYDTGTVPGPVPVPKTIKRDYGFGTAQGTVRVVRSDGSSQNLTVSNWNNDYITVQVPASINTSDEGGTIEVQKPNVNATTPGRKSLRGVTLHVGTTNMPSNAPVLVGPARTLKTIQAAIDAPGTRDGDLIIVDPGVYEEAPILWKRVRVQGYGAPATIVNASMGADPVRQAAWRKRVCELILVPQVVTGQPNRTMVSALLSGQTVPADMDACLTGDTADNAPLLFASEEASGFFVLSRPCSAPNADGSCPNNSVYNPAQAPFGTGGSNNTRPRALQIDGFTVTGADTGGGIVANGHAHQLQISNNVIKGNQGIYNGGIRIGHASLMTVAPVTDNNPDPVEQPVDANNRLVNIHHNEILMNGNTAGETTGGGGGVSIYTGAQGYRVAHNYIAGNYSTGDGGGMVHFGASGYYNAGNSSNNNIEQDNRTTGGGGNSNNTGACRSGGNNHNYVSTVSHNQFRFNQSFSQAKSVQGGGLAVVGIVDPGPNNGVTLGTGCMVVLNNVFQGNLAGAGDGGGIALVGVNGTTDVTSETRRLWNRVDILGNVITNNGTGVSGGGISMQDAGNVHIVNNTVSMNDSFATAARAFTGGTGINNPNPLTLISTSVVQDGAGITAYGHSAGLRAVIDAQGNNNTNMGNSRYFSDAEIVNTVVVGNRSRNWSINYNANPATCSYDVSQPCFGLGPVADQNRAGNDIAVRFPGPGAPSPARLQPVSSVFSALNANDGTSIAGNNNREGSEAGINFSSAYLTENNGALRQLLLALEQTVIIGAPVAEVQEPGVVTAPQTAAAFDEGGNFIDVRFGPLTRGGCNSTGLACNGAAWTDFGTYNPNAAAIATGAPFANGATSVQNPNGGGTTSLSTAYPRLTPDLDGITRPLTGGNVSRGALVTPNYVYPQP